MHPSYQATYTTFPCPHCQFAIPATMGAGMKFPCPACHAKIAAPIGSGPTAAQADAHVAYMLDHGNTAAALAAAAAASGSVLPCARKATKPTVTGENDRSSANARAAALSTSSVAAVISGPMPSPSMTTMRTGADDVSLTAFPPRLPGAMAEPNAYGLNDTTLPWSAPPPATQIGER